MVLSCVKPLRLNGLWAYTHSTALCFERLGWCTQAIYCNLGSISTRLHVSVDCISFATQFSNTCCNIFDTKAATCLCNAKSVITSSLGQSLQHFLFRSQFFHNKLHFKVKLNSHSRNHIIQLCRIKVKRFCGTLVYLPSYLRQIF